MRQPFMMMRLSGEALRLDDVEGVGSCNPELVHVLHHPRQQLGAAPRFERPWRRFPIVGQNREERVLRAGDGYVRAVGQRAL